MTLEGYNPTWPEGQTLEDYDKLVEEALDAARNFWPWIDHISKAYEAVVGLPPTRKAGYLAPQTFDAVTVTKTPRNTEVLVFGPVGSSSGRRKEVLVTTLGDIIDARRAELKAEAEKAKDPLAVLQALEEKRLNAYEDFVVADEEAIRHYKEHAPKKVKVDGVVLTLRESMVYYSSPYMSYIGRWSGPLGSIDRCFTLHEALEHAYDAEAEAKAEKLKAAQALKGLHADLAEALDRVQTAESVYRTRFGDLNWSKALEDE